MLLLCRWIGMIAKWKRPESTPLSMTLAGSTWISIVTLGASSSKIRIVSGSLASGFETVLSNRAIERCPVRRWWTSSMSA